jgi:hypothetical protein
MPLHRIFPHGRWRELLPGLWIIRGKIRAPLYRNMVVVRLPSGELVIHSAIALDDVGMAELETIGRPAYAIVPNADHQMDAPFYAARYPSLKMVCPAAARLEISPAAPIAAAAEEVLPGLGFRLHAVPGSTAKEYVYDYALPSGDRVLIIKDMIFGPNATPAGIAGRLMSLLLVGFHDGYGIARIYRRRMVTDLPALKQFIATLANIAGLRLVTISHGDPMTANPAAKLRAIAR